MFQDLDITLINMLSDPNDPTLPSDLRDADKSFTVPDSTFPPTLNRLTVNLFLYDVKENRELRDPVPIVEKVGNTFIRRQPPMRVDCSYIVTAWSNLVGAVKVADEHRLLSETLIWLSRFPTLPDKYLPADWKDNTKPSYQPFPPQTWIAQMDPNKNAGEFWNALGISPRSAFYMTVTIAMDVGVRQEGFLVTTRTTTSETAGETGSDNWVQIGGQVLTSSGQGIPEALVDILDAGLRTKTEADGRYSFLRVPAGQHDFRVVAVGFQPQTQKLDIPGLPGSYDMTMTPL